MAQNPEWRMDEHKMYLFDGGRQNDGSELGRITSVGIQWV